MAHFTHEQIIHSYFHYVPNLAANSVGIALFSLILACQILFGLYTRQWWFVVTWTMANILELLGYIARVVAHGNIDDFDMFKMQLVCLILGPAFMSAGIYYLLAKVITVHGEKYSPLPPMMYSAIFVVADVVSIVVQAVGGGMAASSDKDTSRTGSWIMVGGICIQVLSISIFILLCLLVVYKIWKDRVDPEVNYDPNFAHIRSRPLFKYMVPGMLIGTMFIFIRSVYRVVELSEGWSGHLMVTERYFLVLDGLMIFLGECPLTFCHPGFSLGRRPIPVRGLHYKANAKSPLEMRGNQSHSSEEYEDAIEKEHSGPEAVRSNV